MKKILVPIDGSKNSDKAILKAKAIAEQNNSEVTLFYAVNDTMISNPYIIRNDYKAELSTILTQQGSNILKEGLNIFGPYEGKINTILKYGDPGKSIISYAEDNGYDLIVMGSRGLNTISRFMLGSVSLKVVNHVDISVLIVK